SCDLVGRVTSAAAHEWDVGREAAWAAPFGGEPNRPRLRCVAYDFGAKRNIFRLLHEAGFDVTVVPATLQAREALALAAYSVYLANVPGVPAPATYAIEAVRGLVVRVPMFGTCLGHQIAALAIG